jgi:hypothetical protein
MTILGRVSQLPTGRRARSITRDSSHQVTRFRGFIAALSAVSLRGNGRPIPPTITRDSSGPPNEDFQLPTKGRFIRPFAVLGLPKFQSPTRRALQLSGGAMTGT